MALVGNCSHTVYTEHETETALETITYPDGTSTTLEMPVVIPTTTNYENVYVCIKQIENFNYWDDLGSYKNIIYQFAGYKDKATRDADQENYLFWESATLQNYDHDLNLYSQIYDEIKSTNGYTDLMED